MGNVCRLGLVTLATSLLQGSPNKTKRQEVSIPMCHMHLLTTSYCTTVMHTADIAFLIMISGGFREFPETSFPEATCNICLCVHSATNSYRINAAKPLKHTPCQRVQHVIICNFSFCKRLGKRFGKQARIVEISPQNGINFSQEASLAP